MKRRRLINVSFCRINVGNTNYNALETKFEQRFSRVFILISYRRSTLTYEASSVFDPRFSQRSNCQLQVADSYNRKLERDVSSGDIPNASFRASPMNYRLTIVTYNQSSRSLSRNGNRAERTCNEAPSRLLPSKHRDSTKYEERQKARYSHERRCGESACWSM